MEILTARLDQLREGLESAAFLSSQGSTKEAHSEIFRCAGILSEIRQLCSTIRSTQLSSISALESETVVDNQQGNEVKKVRNRLKLWARHQDQINARILNGYLDLEKLGTVTEASLRRHLSGLNFSSNFAQMKIIAERNHGKIFDQREDVITIWPPIDSFVRDYQKELQK